MGIVFAARSDNSNYTARYGNGGLTGVPFLSAGSFSYAVDAGAIGGNVWQFPTTGIKGLSFPARKNTPNGREISALLRRAPAFTGAPSASYGIMALVSNIGRGPLIELQHLTTSGNIAVLVRNEGFTAGLNASSAGSWSPTSGTWYDLFFSWDGTTNANSFKVYIDGVLLGSLTPTAAFSASWTNEFFNEIVFGLSDTFAGSGVSYGKFSECIIWDEVKDPTSIALVGGTGSLNGASRTAFVDVSALDGTSWTALTADKIKIGESQTQAGVAVVGTYDASERYTNVSESNVLTRQGAFKYNSTTNNKTPNATLPGASDVVSGVQFGANGTEFTGTNTGTIVYEDGDFKQSAIISDDSEAMVIINTDLEEDDGVTVISSDHDTNDALVCILSEGLND